MLAFAVSDLGKDGYSIGFVVYLFLGLLSLVMTWILKYSYDVGRVASPVRVGEPAQSGAGR